jgi:hypothetical protein
MNFRTVKSVVAGIFLASSTLAFSPVSAAPVSITIHGMFTDAPVSLTGGVSNTLSSFVGLGFDATFTYDTTGGTINDEFASPAEGGTGQELGTEFTGGSATPIIPLLPVTPPDTNTYTSPTLIAEMENNVTRTAADLLNLLPGGTYDFFSVNGWEPSSTFSGGSTITGDGDAIDAINFGLLFIDVDATMLGTLTSTDLMPEAIDLSLVDFVFVALEEFAGGELIGFAYQFGTIDEGGTFTEFTIASNTEIPEPGILALFPLALGVIGFARRNRRRAA